MIHAALLISCLIHLRMTPRLLNSRNIQLAEAEQTDKTSAGPAQGTKLTLRENLVGLEHGKEVSVDCMITRYTSSLWF
jgi:hypothetical protein